MNGKLPDFRQKREEREKKREIRFNLKYKKIIKRIYNKQIIITEM